jgi:hypothetical protein
MDHDASTSASPAGARHTDVHWPTVVEEIPESPRAAVAKYRGWAESENSRHPAPVGGQSQVSDRIDASVHAVKPPSSDPPADSLVVEPSLLELGDGDDPVLPGGDRRRFGVSVGAFLAHTARKAPGPAKSPPALRSAVGPKWHEDAILQVCLAPRPGVFSCKSFRTATREKWLAEMSASR